MCRGPPIYELRSWMPSKNVLHVLRAYKIERHLKKMGGGEAGRIDGGLRFATVILSPIALFHYYNARRYFFAGCAPVRSSRVRNLLFRGLRGRSFARLPRRYRWRSGQRRTARRGCARGHHSSFGEMMNRQHNTLIDAPDDGERIISGGADKNVVAAEYSLRILFVCPPHAAYRARPSAFHLRAY